MAVKHTFASAKSDAADATLVRPSNWNAAHTIDPISLTQDMLWTSAKYPARVVATTNQTKSGLATIDGVTVSSGDVILLTAQTTGSENGPWLARSGSWVRPTWFPAATAFSLVEREQHTFIVWDGTQYAASAWRSSLTSGTTYTIDTDALTYTLMKSGGGWFANGARIYGEMSDTVTVANRTFFQSAPGGVIGGVGNTLLGALPSGTAQTCVFHFYAKNDPTADQAFARMGMIGNGTGGDMRLVGGVVGAGVQPSFSIVMNAITRLSINTAIYDVQWGQNNTFPTGYAATTNWMQMFLGNDATLAYATDTGAAKELNITQNGYLNNAAWTYRETDFASQIRMLSGSVRLRYQPSGTALGAMGAWATALMMSNTGHILIGSTTDNGTDALQVTGSTKLTGALAMTGALASYNGTTTSDFGQPVIVYSKLFTGQGAAIAATNLIASLAATGMYRVNWSATITRVATTSCSLGGTNGFQVLFTSPGDSVAKTTKVIASDVNATNSTASAVYGVRTAYAKAATAMQFQFDYTSVGATTMQYELYITVEYLGPCAA